MSRRVKKKGGVVEEDATASAPSSPSHEKSDGIIIISSTDHSASIRHVAGLQSDGRAKTPGKVKQSTLGTDDIFQTPL